MTEILKENYIDVVWEGKRYLLSRDSKVNSYYTIWLKELNYLSKVGTLANRTEAQAIYEVKTFFEENKYAGKFG